LAVIGMVHQGGTHIYTGVCVLKLYKLKNVTWRWKNVTAPVI